MEAPPRQKPEAAAAQELRDLSSTRGPSTGQVPRVVILVLLSGVVLLLAGLTLAGTLIGLAVTAPLFILFSPVLIPAALTIGLVVTGFLMSAAFVLVALYFFMRMNSQWTRMREQCTISGGQRRDSGPSASIDNGKGKSVVAEDPQQQKNERTIPGRQSGNDGVSVSSNSVIGNDYDVFLSFRGPDTRKSFVDHLYHKLKNVGLRFHPNFVFRDNEELPFGEDLRANLISAIMQSKVSIPVISKTYAASEWCLYELICIMECKKSRGQIVLPVLYKVEAKDVKYLKGSVKKAIESRKRWSDEAVKRQGIEALGKVAECRVYESEKFAGGHEAELVDVLVAAVMHKLQEDFRPYLLENFIKNDNDVDEVMRLVDTAHSNTRIIGIYGISGIGKTTLATNIYGRLTNKFGCHSFHKDVGEKIKRNGIEHVQSQLISDILIQKFQVHDSDMGINIIQTKLTKKKVLILLDDVNDQDQLNKLIGDCRFALGSRVIITCRDEATLKLEYYKYKCKELNSTNSLRLFNIHAFEGKPPPVELVSLSSEIVAITGGLPLALIVFGSLLKRTKDPKLWEEYRDKWRKVPEKAVMDKLKISYDILEKSIQQMFLDIACLFIGIDHRIATYPWSDLKLYPRIGLQKMMELSLISYDDNNQLRMHDQLRDLGRNVARPAEKKPWDCKRLWDEEAMEVLGRKEKNENIEALRLDERGSKEFMEQKSFENMPNLKFLHVKDVDFNGDFKGSLSELRLLKWERCPDSFKATNVHLKRLVALDLSSDDIRGNFISENWRGWSTIKMEKLKVLNLSRCTTLKRTPNLSTFKSLEMIILESCENLEEIDTSIGNVKCLTSLDLSSCSKLQELPESIGQLDKLEELDATECLSLKGGVPINGLSSLKILRLGKICHTADLIGLHIDGVYKLLEDFHDLSSREHLDLTNCELPASLTVLEVTSHNRTLPELSRLILLKELSFQFCEFLESIPVLPSRILNLWVFWCGKLKELPDLSSLNFLSELRIIGCSELIKVEGLEGLKSLRELSICGCKKLLNLNGLERLESLRDLEIKELDAPLMTDDLDLVQCIGGLKNFRELRIDSCRSLRRPNISQLAHLQNLWVIECENITEIKCLERLEKLRSLNIVRCDSIEKLPDLSLFHNLDRVYINGCPKLRVQGQGLEKVKYVHRM